MPKKNSHLDSFLTFPHLSKVAVDMTIQIRQGLFEELFIHGKTFINMPQLGEEMLAEFIFKVLNCCENV